MELLGQPHLVLTIPGDALLRTAITYILNGSWQAEAILLPVMGHY